MWWSWALAAIGVTGLYLTTRRDWRGYLVGGCVQVLWIAYAIVTHQWGFIVSAVAYGAVNALGLYRWRTAEPKLLKAFAFEKGNQATQVKVVKIPTLPKPPPPPPPSRNKCC